MKSVLFNVHSNIENAINYLNLIHLTGKRSSAIAQWTKCIKIIENCVHKSLG